MCILVTFWCNGCDGANQTRMTSSLWRSVQYITCREPVSEWPPDHRVTTNCMVERHPTGSFSMFMQVSTVWTGLYFAVFSQQSTLFMAGIPANDTLYDSRRHSLRECDDVRPSWTARTTLFVSWRVYSSPQDLGQRDAAPADGMQLPIGTSLVACRF
jgi:hypothetical protein